VNGRPLPEHRVKIGLGQDCRGERPEPLLDGQRPREGFLHRHLLVERKPHEQRHRVLGDQLVGFVGVGEVQLLRHIVILWPARQGCGESAGGPASSAGRN